MVRPLVRFALLFGTLGAIAAGCGAQSLRENGGEAGDSGETGSGASSGSSSQSGRSGTSGSAGTLAQAGQAGQGGTGSSIAGSGNSPGSGGSMIDICSASLPDLAATCDEGDGRFFHDPATGECFYGCPAGSGVMFDSLGTCLSACAGSMPAVSACDAARDCAWAVPGCCGGCEPVDPATGVALNRSRADAVAGCAPGVLCGACEDVQELERVGQYLIPSCVNHTCTISDIRKLPATECEEDSDCTLRAGSNCCEGCGSPGLIAVSSYDWVNELCPLVLLPCPECEPVIPDNFVAECNRNRCVVVEYTPTPQ